MKLQWVSARIPESGIEAYLVVACAPKEDHERAKRIIEEAGTVATETGLGPRQLAEHRAELLEALKQARKTVFHFACAKTAPAWTSLKEIEAAASMHPDVRKIDAAIAKAEGRG